MSEYEDVYFYLDMTKEILKKKHINQAIEYYIQEKNKTNIKGHYSVLIFQEEGDPIFITNKKDSDIITKIIDESWKTRPKKQSYFENGLFYIFSYIAESIRKKSKYNRVLIITDTPSDLNESYQDALFNLVSKIRFFPTFIDIIRISDKDTRFFKDDVKLNVLANDTKGGIFYVKNKNEFMSVFKKLIKSKQLITTFADQPDQIKISQQDYSFYSRLAKQLRPEFSLERDKMTCHFCGEVPCPVCVSDFDIPLKCEDCGALFHNCCATNFTINNNIGIPHIWRCPNCDVLLQINEDDIVNVDNSELENGSEFTSVKDYIGVENLEKSQINDVPKIIDSDFERMEPPFSDDHDLPKPSLSPIPMRIEDIQEPQEDNKQIRIGGFFGKIYSVKKIDDKLVYEKIKRSDTSYKAGSNIDPKKQMSFSEESFFDNSISQKPENRRRFRLKICPQCSTPISMKQGNNCLNCGYQL